MHSETDLPFELPTVPPPPVSMRDTQKSLPQAIARHPQGNYHAITSPCRLKRRSGQKRRENNLSIGESK
jgi:hypothetical protein